MKKKRQLFIIISFGLGLLVLQTTYGQLEFCSGNSGDAIFTEDFGAGTLQGPELPAGTTTYNFTTGTPNDGSYTISSNSRFFEFHDIPDHTPGDTNGKMFIINADDSINGGEFFKTTINGLCENTTYEFSSWLINLLSSNSGCPGGGIPINVKFQILDSATNAVLKEGNTNNIAGTPAPVWNQYGLVFKTRPGENSVILKMLNNGIGGCGNDLAIDDIAFRTCGDFVSLTDTTNSSFLIQCEDQGAVSTTLTVTPDFSIFASHAYQWQVSADATTWNDIAGETSNIYNTPPLTTDTFYRVKVAEDPINLNNNSCNIVSDVFDINIIPQPNAPVTNGNISACSNAIKPISVTVPSGIKVNWYDAPTGGSLLLENSPTYTAEIQGTYFAEAESGLGDCFSATRTAVNLTINEPPLVTDENLQFCKNQFIDLSADINNASYQWNNGETTREIRVREPGTYTVEITDANSCTVIKTIELNQIGAPQIDTIISDEYSIIISTLNEGDFQYSIDGNTYRDSPIFNDQEGGLYVISVIERSGCGLVNINYIHFVVPKFFTPNGDTKHDTFELAGLENYNTSEVSIFNRYGQLMKTSKNTSFSWDGTLDGRPVPASDYWYVIQTDGIIRKGHFALKR